MGLAIGVGVLADLLEHDPEGAAWMREQVATVNRVLRDNHIEPVDEPETPVPMHPRAVGSFPYSTLHYLRRAYTCVRAGEPLRHGELTDDDQEYVMDWSVSWMDSHLLSHSDAEGFYAPREFDFPLLDEALPGHFLGSTHVLMDELRLCASGIGIQLNGLDLPDAEREKLWNVDYDAPLGKERMAWLALWQACELSIQHGSLIVFH